MSADWKAYLRLLKKKYRLEERKFIVEGVRLCREALLSDWNVECAFLTEDFMQSGWWMEFREYFLQKHIPFQVLSGKNIHRLAETQTPQGVLLVMHFPEDDWSRLNLRKAAFILILQSVRDPGNLGTLIRTADWFGVNGVILTDDCVDPFNPKVLRGSMGSFFHLPVIEVSDIDSTIKSLKDHHFLIVATSLSSNKVLHKIRFRKPIALILGGEAQGISYKLQGMADINLRIWKYGEAESLNVAVAGGIIMDYVANQIFLKNKNK